MLTAPITYIPDMEDELIEARHTAKIAERLIEQNYHDLPEELIYAIYAASRTTQAAHDKYYAFTSRADVRIMREWAA